MDLQKLVDAAHANSKAHGFWEPGENQDIGTKMSLIHSELSEALEEYRLTDEYRGGKLGQILFEKPNQWGIPDRSPNDIALDAPASDGPRPRKPAGFIVELADAAIRLFDLCGWQKVQLKEVPPPSVEDLAELEKMTIGTLLSVAHAGVVGLAEPQDATLATHSELLALLEYIAHKVDGDLYTAIDIKMQYNATRPFKHGGKAV